MSGNMVEWVEPPLMEHDKPMAFAALVNVCAARGVERLNGMCSPGELVEVKVDGRWTAWINPHREATEKRAEPLLPSVPAFTAYVEWNGWPWGFISPHWQQVVEHESYDGANSPRFVRDCRAAFDAEATP